MLKRALGQIKMIESSIIDSFLGDPALANYGQANAGMVAEESFDGGDRQNLKSRERKKQ